MSTENGLQIYQKIDFFSNIETCSQTPLSNRLRALSRSEHRTEMRTVAGQHHTALPSRCQRARR